MKVNTKKAAMLLMLVQIMAGTACTKDAISVLPPAEGEEVNVKLADFEAVPRRCRVVKRYRAKGEVYTVVVNTPNNPNTIGGSVLVSFAETDASLKAPDGVLTAVPVKSQGRNGKEIEMETPEFTLGGKVAQKTLTVRVEVRNRAGKTQDVLYYDAPLGPESRQPVTYEAKPAARPIVDNVRITVTPEKDGSINLEKGTLDVSIAIANDLAKEITAVNLQVKPLSANINLTNTASLIAPIALEKGLRFYSRPAAIGFAGNVKEASLLAEILLINGKNEVVAFTVKEVKDLADILKE